MANPLEVFQRSYADRTAAAQAFRRAGGRVVGYACDNVPVELIIAAGFFPLRVAGKPGKDVTPVRTLVDPLYPPDVTVRPAFADAILSRLLDGTYAALDYLIIPHNRNAIQAFHRELRDAACAWPELRIPELHYLDKAWSPTYAAEVYNRDSVLKLHRRLEAWAGREVTVEQIAQAIEVCDENRRLLGEVVRLRTADPPRVSGTDALAIFGSSMFMDKAEHNGLLKAWLAEAGQAPPRSGPRIFIAGSPQDQPWFYELVERCGATVVSEDHCWGARTCDLFAAVSADPLQALAERFHRRPACSVLFPIERTIEASVGRARSAGVDGAIFYVMEGDWTQSWEAPDEVKRLRAAGVSVLHLRRQPYEPAGPDLERQVAEFVASLAARPAGEAA